jgi:hypothetical protein
MDPRLCPCVMRSTSHGCARCTGRGTATGKTFKARLAKLERWLAPRCRAVRALQFTSTRNVYSSQTRMTALVVEAARLSLRTIDVCVGQQGPDTDVAKQKGSVLAFSLAIHQCQALTHLKIRVLEMHSLWTRPGCRPCSPARGWRPWRSPCPPPRGLRSRVNSAPRELLAAGTSRSAVRALQTGAPEKRAAASAVRRVTTAAWGGSALAAAWAATACARNDVRGCPAAGHRCMRLVRHSIGQ